MTAIVAVAGNRNGNCSLRPAPLPCPPRAPAPALAPALAPTRSKEGRYWLRRPPVPQAAAAKPAEVPVQYGSYYSVPSKLPYNPSNRALISGITFRPVSTDSGYRELYGNWRQSGLPESTAALFGPGQY
eukprot:COSAG02_NODE_4585_length_5189_cov_9.203929_3_plen_129_part_00